ncbi:MAG: DUF4493 domain-containing protein [Muribaculaceae bacterium]|nr:DUF4493 domain-containing protein [Muribaculaceae bacterium]
MNHFKCLGIIALSGLALAGCGEEEFVQGGGNGKLRVEVDVNPSLLTSRSARSASSGGVVNIDASELMLQLTSTDESWSKSWDSVDELNADGEVPAGTYKMEAYYGSPYAQGFESPYFYGAADVTVRTGETTEAGLTASLANAMMTITYSESMAGYLSAYSAELQCAGTSEPIEYAQGETRPAYVRTGEVAVYVNVTKPSGASARLLAGTVTAEARHHYFVNIDMNAGAGAGDAQLVVTFDDDFVTDEYVIDLSDELLDAPAPQVTAVGFGDGVVKHYARSPYAADLRFDIYAPGKIGKVILNTTNAQAISEMWPEQVDLMALPANMQQAVKDFGLGVRGLWQDAGDLACIDFAGLLSNINVPEGQDEVNLSFTLTAVDKYGKASEAAPTLNVRIEPKFGVTVTDAWASRAYFTVYNLEDQAIKYTEGVTVEVSADGEQFATKPIELQPDGQWLVTGLQPNTAYSLRATLDGAAGSRINFVTEPANQLPNSGMEDWHTVNGKTKNWWVEYPWADGEANPAWNTLNQLTTSEGGSITSAFNSNRDGCAYNAYSGTRVTADSHVGRAAIIETVGWGRGNTAGGSVANVVKYRTAGELYLGTYDESAQAGNYGYAFETRPLALEFYYKYSPKNPADYGTAVMEVLNENGEVIGSTGVVALTGQSAYTLMSAPIVYTDFHSKAAQVKVIFKSTVGNDGTHDFLAMESNNFSWAPFGNTSNGRNTGSSLYIDDINLAY